MQEKSKRKDWQLNLVLVELQLAQNDGLKKHVHVYFFIQIILFWQFCIQDFLFLVCNLLPFSGSTKLMSNWRWMLQHKTRMLHPTSSSHTITMYSNHSLSLYEISADWVFLWAHLMYKICHGLMAVYLCWGLSIFAHQWSNSTGL